MPKPRSNLLRASIAALFFFCNLAHAQSISDITDLILVTGQSNVTGSQTDFDPQIDTIDLRVFAYTDTNDWEVADLHQVWDVDGVRPGNGSLNPACLADPNCTPSQPYNNFAFHFAKTVVENDPERVVGIIIASAPGEGILHWDANRTFTQTIQSKVIAALNAQGVKSKLDGILWHQGETDHQFYGTSYVDATAAEKSDDTYYPDKLTSLIQRFRAESWFDSDRPFICGETKKAPVNGRLMALNSDNDPWTGCVAGQDLPTREMDLTTNPPKLGTHFTAEGLRTLGRRYGLKYLDMTSDSDPKLPGDGKCNGLTANVVIATGDMPTSSADIILGTAEADTINGLGGDDIICGLGGDDIINGGNGDDWIDAGTGNDTVNGGNDDDTIFGDSGTDTLNGGPGNDEIYGEDDDDFVNGNSGNDTLKGGDGIDQIIGGSGDDNIDTGDGGNRDTGLLVNGGAGNDTMTGGSGDDEIRGATGDDTISGSDGDDALFGGGGNDTINGQNGDDDIRGNGSNDTLIGGNGADDIDGGDGIDTISGGNDNDVIRGATGNDILNGGPRDDHLSGGGGNDIIYGNRGNDTLVGGGSNDTLVGGSDTDNCDGNGGTDTTTSCESTSNIP